MAAPNIAVFGCICYNIPTTRKVGDGMLNYANLNDMEFEALCKDIMEQMIGVSLRRFGPGRDHGVDLTDDASTKAIVVQVKHYRNSTTDQLVRSLKNELSKVTELAPQQYYICCSRELSADNIKALYQHFQAYMASDRHIVTLVEIDDFLKQEANRDILKKHFKLWLDSTGILEELLNDDIFVDCDALLSEMADLQKLFVRTSAFDKALKVLESNQPLCIIGDPGVGKSITSKMLVLHYAALGYRVRYTTDVADLKSLKKALRDDAVTKEVILLDDCFGQAYFEMKSSQSSELVALIKYVKLHPNKVLILNSRVTIFQEARERHWDLIQSMEREEFRICVLDMNKLSGEEKAKILYNHLTFSDIPDSYFENIQANQRYRNIIFHRNYNPRIIWFVCNPNRYRNIPADQFYGFIQRHLDNPQEMWANEYKHRLQPTDRILLQTIYSLTVTTVNADLVRRCFERRISGIPTIDKTLDQYSCSLNRLNEGFIKILDNKGNQELSMQNPSVNDFLTNRLRNCELEYQELVRSIYTVPQLRLLPKESRIPFITNLLMHGKIDSLFFPSHQYRTAVIGFCILHADLCLANYRSELIECISHLEYFASISSSPIYERLTTLAHVINPEIWECYQLTAYFAESNNLYSFLRNWHLGDIVSFINSCDSYFCGTARDSYIRQTIECLSDSINEFCDVDAVDYDIGLDVESAIRLATDIDGDVDINEATSILEEEIQEDVFSDLKQLILSLPEPFTHMVDNYNLDDIYVGNADYLVEDYLENPPGHYDPDVDDDSDDRGYSSIDAIFER